VIMTCKTVKAPTDIPRIMGIPPLLAHSLAEKSALPCLQLQQEFATSEMGPAWCDARQDDANKVQRFAAIG